MTHTPAARPLEVRHVQLARAAIAAIAAVMVTFSPDHSAPVGLAVFSGFALLSSLVLLVASRIVYPIGSRWPVTALGVLAGVAGMVAGVGQLRTIAVFFVVVIAWALAAGLVETIASGRALRAARETATEDAARSQARDGVVIGILTVLLGVALLLVPTQYALSYTIEDADATFTLTGIIIGVGIFGGYAAIAAVYLAIAGFSPRSPSRTGANSTARNDDRGAA